MSASRAGVYAAAAGLAASIPIPWVDQMVSEAARAAALRGVAERYGLRLDAEVQRLLAAPGVSARSNHPGVRLIRTALNRFVMPWRWFARLEEGLAVFVAVLLLDDYLAKRAQDGASTRFDRAEAERVRRAIDAALLQTSLQGVVEIPTESLRFFRQSAQALRQASEGGPKARLEGVADVLLEGIGALPDALRQRLRTHFEAALAKEGR